MKLYDAHTHLNAEPLVKNRKSYLQKFIDVGGAGLVNSGASESYNVQGIEIAKIAEHDFPSCMVKATLGRHPLECVDGTIVAKDIPARMKRLRELYMANTQYIVAIGETGLDAHYPNGPETLDIQKQLFIEHCKLARESDLPLVVHSRDAFEETLTILEDFPDMTIYFHCRGYGPKEVKRLQVEGSRLGRRLFIGFCGNITYKNAQALRDTLAEVPLDQLLLETDAPYLTPQAVRGQDNHPANVKYIYDFVAETLKISPEALSQQLDMNFRLLYKLK